MKGKGLDERVRKRKGLNERKEKGLNERVREEKGLREGRKRKNVKQK